IAPPPEPSMTAKRRRVSRSNCDGSMPASRSASSAAAMAIGTTRETCFMFLASTQREGSNAPVTARGTREGSEEASNCVIGRTPLWPAASAAKYRSRPTPFGLSAPTPVITIRDSRTPPVNVSCVGNIATIRLAMGRVAMVVLGRGGPLLELHRKRFDRRPRIERILGQLALADDAAAAVEAAVAGGHEDAEVDLAADLQRGGVGEDHAVDAEVARLAAHSLHVD